MMLNLMQKIQKTQKTLNRNIKMAQNKMQLPPRKWYSLEQAIKYIYKKTGEELDVIDLIHYWVNNEIRVNTQIYINSKTKEFILGNIGLDVSKIVNFSLNPFVYLDGEKPKNLMTKDNSFIYLTGKELNLFQEIVSTFETESKEINNENIEEENVYLCGRVSVVINCFNAINPFFIKEEDNILKNGLPINMIQSLISPIGYELTEGVSNKDGVKLYFDIEYESNKKIGLGFFFILNDDLNDFINGKYHKEEIVGKLKDKKQSNLFSKTVKENQISFIKALLFIEYGVKTPQEAKNIINSGELGRRIARLKSQNPMIEEELGIKFPTGETVYNWYKNT